MGSTRAARSRTRRLVRADLLASVGGYRAEMDPCADYDLCLRLSEAAAVARLRRPLYQYRVHPRSVSQREPARIRAAARRAVEEAIRRRGLSSTVALAVDADGTFRLVEPSPTTKT